MQSNVILSIWDENENLRGKKIKTVVMTVIIHTRNEEAQYTFLFYIASLTWMSLCTSFFKKQTLKFSILYKNRTKTFEASVSQPLFCFHQQEP